MISGLSRREKNIILIGFLIAFVMVVYLYLAQPAWQEYVTRKTELAALEQNVAVLEAAEKKLPERKENIVQLKNEITALRAQLPVTKETAGMVYMLNTYTVATGVILNEFKAGDFQENGAVPSTYILPTSIRVTGTYPQLRQFVAKMENPQRLLHINGLSIEQDGNLVKGNFSVSAFSVKTGDQELNKRETIPRSPASGKPNPFL
ncbi:type 4a pilus biogenesis protein PilO [Phosphitispora sp. TUW77]|uniref:type 4a pilus biogenesis protein PilO n=1 Tax=Phosphitispora sp. TUW77 TaxID=3152361 RepID=UPI003AB15EF4